MNPFMQALQSGGSIVNQSMANVSSFLNNSLNAFNAAGSLQMKMLALLEEEEAKRSDTLLRTTALMDDIMKTSLSHQEFLQNYQLNKQKYDLAVKQFDEAKKEFEVKKDWKERALSAAEKTAEAAEKTANAKWLAAITNARNLFSASEYGNSAAKNILSVSKSPTALYYANLFSNVTTVKEYSKAKKEVFKALKDVSDKIKEEKKNNGSVSDELFNQYNEIYKIVEAISQGVTPKKQPNNQESMPVVESAYWDGISPRETSLANVPSSNEPPPKTLGGQQPPTYEKPIILDDGRTVTDVSKFVRNIFKNGDYSVVMSDLGSFLKKALETYGVEGFWKTGVANIVEKNFKQNFPIRNLTDEFVSRMKETLINRNIELQRQLSITKNREDRNRIKMKMFSNNYLKELLVSSYNETINVAKGKSSDINTEQKLERWMSFLGENNNWKDTMQNMVDNSSKIYTAVVKDEFSSLSNIISGFTALDFNNIFSNSRYGEFFKQRNTFPKFLTSIMKNAQNGDNSSIAMVVGLKALYKNGWNVDKILDMGKRYNEMVKKNHYPPKTYKRIFTDLNNLVKYYIENDIITPEKPNYFRKRITYLEIPSGVVKNKKLIIDFVNSLNGSGGWIPRDFITPRRLLNAYGAMIIFPFLVRKNK